VCDLRNLYADNYGTKLGHPGGERKLIRSWHQPIAAGSKGGRSMSVKSHYIKYEKTTVYN
jgi:hypothetical protein